MAQALALLELPEPIQASVEAGELAPSTAYAIAKLEDPAVQATIAARVVSESLSRAETAKVVDEAMARSGGSKPKVGKGKVASKGKPKLPSERTVKTAAGLKVVVSGRKGFDVLAWVEALEDAARQARSRLEPTEQGGETAAA